jgi:hypothetical protein
VDSAAADLALDPAGLGAHRAPDRRFGRGAANIVEYLLSIFPLGS